MIQLSSYLWKTIKSQAKEVWEVVEKAFKYDKDLATIFIHYVRRDLHSKKERDAVVESDYMEKWYRNFKDCVDEYDYLPDASLLLL